MEVKWYIEMAWQSDKITAQAVEELTGHKVRYELAIYIIRYLHDDPHAYTKIYWQGRYYAQEMAFHTRLFLEG